MPTPNTVRPPASRSSVAVCRASTHGRRRGTGVIIGPSTIVEVCAAATDSTAHGSTIGGPCPSLANTMWSQRKKPSKPALLGLDREPDQLVRVLGEAGRGDRASDRHASAWASSAASVRPWWSVVSTVEAGRRAAQDRHQPGPVPGLRAAAVHDDADGQVTAPVAGVVPHVQVVDRDQVAEPQPGQPERVRDRLVDRQVEIPLLDGPADAVADHVRRDRARAPRRRRRPLRRRSAAGRARPARCCAP